LRETEDGLTDLEVLKLSFFTVLALVALKKLSEILPSELVSEVIKSVEFSISKLTLFEYELYGKVIEYRSTSVR